MLSPCKKADTFWMSALCLLYDSSNRAVLGLGLVLAAAHDEDEDQAHAEHQRDCPCAPRRERSPDRSARTGVVMRRRHQGRRVPPYGEALVLRRVGSGAASPVQGEVPEGRRGCHADRGQPLTRFAGAPLAQGSQTLCRVDQATAWFLRRRMKRTRNRPTPSISA